MATLQGLPASPKVKRLPTTTVPVSSQGQKPTTQKLHFLIGEVLFFLRGFEKKYVRFETATAHATLSLSPN